MTTAEYIAPSWSKRLVAAGLARPLDLLDHTPIELSLAGRWQCLVKPGLGRRERWRWELPGSSGCHVVYLKRYGRGEWGGFWERLLHQSLRHARGWWESNQSRLLLSAGVRAPRAIAAAEEMHGLFERGSVVLLSAAEGEAFDRVWPCAVAEQAPVTRGRGRHQVVTQLAQFVWHFHYTGLCHRDLYLCHVFVRLAFDGSAAPKFTLIDLARAFEPRWRRLRWIVKDLAQLDASARQIGASRTDRLRFLRAYLGHAGQSANLRLYIAKIVRKSNSILARIARKSRGK